jgi:diaminopimelate decarboxylase
MTDQRQVRPVVMDALRSATEPTIVYDSAGIRSEFARLRSHLEQALGERHPVRILYSAKANAFDALLRWCAAEGIGAAVASTPEFEAARAAGMDPIHATSPGLTRSEMLAMLGAGVTIDVDNLAQLAAIPHGMAVGLRVQVALRPDNTARAEGVSRFGIDMTDPMLKDLLVDGDHRVVRLHAHFRDVGTSAELVDLATILVDNVRWHTDVREINIGGGMTRLYKDHAAVGAWHAVARVLRRLPAGITVIAEPGAQVVTAHGYLATDVISSLHRADGRRLVTLDASKWKLVTWSELELVAPSSGHGDTTRTDLVGPTCYEKDIWMAGVDMPVLAEGDRVVFRGLGAYVTSMARQMHGLPGPRELLV